MKRLGNIQLLVILVLLLAGIVALKEYDSEATDYKFTNRFMSIDPAKLKFVKVADAPTRNSIVIADSAENWVRIVYRFTEGGSYEVSYKDSVWMSVIDKMDNSRTLSFLNEIDTLKGSTFVDSVSEFALYNPEYELDLFNKSGDSIKVECFTREGYLLIRSSQNPNNIFDGRAADSLFQKVYVGRDRFMQKK